MTGDDVTGDDVTDDDVTDDGSASGAAVLSADGATASVATGRGPAAEAIGSSVGAARVAGASAGADCPGAGYRARLATPSGGRLGGRIVGRLSTSKFDISCSICALNSFEARLNSLSALPIWRAISGNFLGPKITSARKNRKIVSEKLMRFIILPESKKRQSLRESASRKAWLGAWAKRKEGESPDGEEETPLRRKMIGVGPWPCAPVVSV